LSFNALDGVQKYNGAVNDTTSTLNFHAKVYMSRGINQIEGPVLPTHRYAGGLYRDTSLSLGR